jgi:purine-binding chemotaxis protein CheW
VSERSERTIDVGRADRPVPSADRLAELRESFDLSFTRPPPARAETVDLLAITVGTDALAVDLSEVAGIVADRAVTRLPGSPPALLGVAALRRQLVPVYDLAMVLGTAGERGPGGGPRWMILATGSPAVALAVDRVDAHLRVPREDAAAGPRPLIDMVAVRATIAGWNQGATSHATSHHV